MARQLPPPYTLVYYKRRLYFLPIPYSPCGRQVAISAFDESSGEAAAGLEILDPSDLSEKVLRGLCKLNGIPYYWVTGVASSPSNYNPYPVPRKTVERCGLPLTLQEYRKVRGCLREIDRQSSVIAELIWYINRRLVSAGAFVTLEEVLRLRQEDLSRDKCMVTLYRSVYGKIEMVSMVISRPIFRRIVKLAYSKSPFVFTNRNGGPMSPKRVIGSFRVAGKQAGIRSGNRRFVLTPGLLRPDYDLSSKTVRRYQKKASRRSFQIDEEDLDHLLLLLPNSRKNAGAKSKYGHRVLLKAIVYLLQTKCKLQNLPAQFPPWSAVHSQIRRWKRKGFIKKVESFLAIRALKKQS